MTQRVDPFDELAALYLTEPDETRDGGGPPEVPPIDLLICSLHMLHPTRSLYSRSLTGSLLKQVCRRTRYVDHLNRIPRQPWPKN